MNATAVLMVVILLLVIGGMIFFMGFMDRKNEEIVALRGEIQRGVKEIERLQEVVEETSSVYQVPGFVTKSSHPMTPLKEAKG